jgi:hypothetical protein
MATETILTTADSAGNTDSLSQVRVQLSTRHPDISLAENPGPILVNTSNVILEVLAHIASKLLPRSPPLCALHTRQHVAPVRETNTFRVLDQWHISSNIIRRVSDC